jgi:HK97 family phage major capsid protein
MDIKAMRDEFANLHAEAGKVIEKAATEKRAITAEETEQNNRRYARMDEIKALVDESQKLASYAFSENKIEQSEPKGKAEFTAAPREFSAADYKRAANEFALYGEVRSRELFGTISTSGSSALMPKAVLPPVNVLTPQNPYKAVLARYGLSTIRLGSTSQLTLPQIDDSANVGATKTEGATSETTPVDPTPTAISLNTSLYESKPSWFSNTVQNANGFDLLGYCLPSISQRLERAKHSAMDTVVKAITTGTVTTASATAVTYAEVLTWEHSLPVAYRYNMAMVVSDSFYKLLRGLADSNGRPIMDVDPTNVFQQTIHGIPIFVSEYLSAVATTNKVGALVNADSLYIREEDPRLTRYVNVPAYADQFGINVFQDCAFAGNSNGVRVIKMA